MFKKSKKTVLWFILYLSPLAAAADIMELSQRQMRQLVLEQQVLSSEVIATDAATTFGGVVMDIRGFLSEGQMTYRLLLRRNDGSVIEVLVNGVDGERVSHRSPMGQTVSAVARSVNGSSNGGGNGNAGNWSNNGNGGNAANNGNGGGRGNGSDNGNRRGNSASNGNNGGGNNGNGNGNGGGRSNGRNK